MQRLIWIAILTAFFGMGSLSAKDWKSGERTPYRDRSMSARETERAAAAAVAVARATLEIADERPLLPDTRPRSAVAPDRHGDAGDTGRTDAQGQSLSSMRIEFCKTAVVQELLPAQLVVAHWARGCIAGDRQERDLRRLLTPLGWNIGQANTDQIQFVDLPQTEPCPQSMLYQNGVIVKSWVGYQDPSFLSHELRRAWDSAPTPLQNVETAGPAGAIHAQPYIQTVLNWWKEHVGERTKASFSWDRTGAQTFPLLAKGDWTAEALFGKSGRVEVSVVGSKSLPIDSFGFGYRVLGTDLSIDVDPIVLKGISRKLGLVKNEWYRRVPSLESDRTASSQLGLMTAWTIATILRDLCSLLHPTCDLQLGGNVSATAVLNAELLTIDFQHAPSVKLVALFTFQLSIQRIEIGERNIHVEFGGSRLVKSRDFEVR